MKGSRRTDNLVYPKIYLADEEPSLADKYFMGMGLPSDAQNIVLHKVFREHGA